jgi:hypothetical protein
VSNPTGFGGEKDRPNVVESGPVETGALRIEVSPQDGFPGGLLQLKRAG